MRLNQLFCRHDYRIIKTIYAEKMEYDPLTNRMSVKHCKREFNVCTKCEKHKPT